MFYWTAFAANVGVTQPYEVNTCISMAGVMPQFTEKEVPDACASII